MQEQEQKQQQEEEEVAVEQQGLVVLEVVARGLEVLEQAGRVLVLKVKGR